MAAVSSCQRLLLLTKSRSTQVPSPTRMARALPERTRVASGTGQCYRRFAAGRPATRCRLTRQSFWLIGGVRVRFVPLRSKDTSYQTQADDLKDKNQCENESVLSRSEKANQRIPAGSTWKP